MKTILVTGGAGFIGGTFVRKFIGNETARIVNLDALTYAGNLDSLSPIEESENHIFVHGDIRDSALVNRLFSEYTPDAVAHFAAESHVDRSIGAPAQFIDTNVVGTQNLLECTRAYWNSLQDRQKESFRFLHVSTDEVYGSLGAEGKFTESTPYAPNSPYSASKAASDHLVRAYFHTFGLPTLISNCSNNYGPYQFPEKLIPLMILNALEGKSLPVYGDGTNIRDWLHVEDHCDALMAVLERGRPGEVYNIGGDAERTNLDVVHAICNNVDELAEKRSEKPSTDLIEFVTDRPGHDQRYAIDATKIQTELQWKPKHTFENGMRETVQWYLDNRAWWESITSGTYQRQRLGVITTENQRRPSKTVPAPAYTDGEIDGIEIKTLQPFRDSRGWLMELFRQDEMSSDYFPVMAYVSETEINVTRGPHEHVDQADFFGFVGPGDFDLYLWDSRPNSPTYGNKKKVRCGEQTPVSVLVPAGVVHAYKNISTEKAGYLTLQTACIQATARNLHQTKFATRTTKIHLIA